jgi:hypothetical protein
MTYKIIIIILNLTNQSVRLPIEQYEVKSIVIGYQFSVWTQLYKILTDQYKKGVSTKMSYASDLG